MTIQSPDVSTLNTTWKILIIDDDEDDYLIARDMLKEAKGRRFEVYWANTYAAGREELINNHYNAVLVDYDLGLHSGIELIREANERGFPSPLILFTGRGSYETDVEAMQAGATLYLTKSEVTPLTLERFIRYAIERKRAEEHIHQLNVALQQRNAELELERARWKGVVEGIADELWISDVQGQMSLINLPSVTAMGLEEFKDWPVEKVLEEVEILNPDGQVRPVEQSPLLRSLRGEIVRGEEMMRHRRTGKLRYRHFSSAPTRDDKGIITGAVAIVHDITNLKQTEEALSQSEAKYRTLFTSVKEGFTLNQAIYDENRQLVDFLVLEANPAAEIANGLSREAFVGKTWRELWPGAEQYWWESCSPVILKGEHITYENYASVHDRWYEVHHFSAGKDLLGSLFMDITERKKMEGTLRENRERLERAQQIAHLGSWELDLVQNRLTWSDEVYRIFGLQPQAFVATYEAFLERVHPDDRAAVDEAYSGSLRENRDTYEIEHRVVRKSTGEIRIVHEKCEHFRDAAGRLIRSVGMVHDITERKQAEEALRVSDERFYKAFHTSPNAQAISRQEDGYILEINEAFEKIFGYSRTELIGKTSLELDMYVYPADRQKYIQKLLENQSVHDYELELRTRTGQIIQTSLSVVMIHVGERPYMLTIFQDITERKQSEEALRASEKRITDFMENTHDYVAALDKDYRYVYVNRRFAEVLGRNANEMIGKNMWEEYPNYLGTIVEHNFRKAMEERVPIHFQLGSLYTPYSYDMSVYPSTDGIFIFAIDRTEAHKVDLALRESEERYRILADSMPHLVWTALSDGTLDYINKRYQEYEGIYQTEGKQWAWWPALHPEDLPPTLAAWQHSIQTGEIYEIEHRVQLKNGSFRWHLSRALPIKDQEGNVIRWFGTSTDIEDQKRTEERLRRSNQELEQFAFVASHDLQEPLRKIKMFGKSLQQQLKGKLEEETQDNFDRMINASGRMQTMINDLLDLSRVSIQGRPFVPVNLSQAMAEVVSDLEPRILSAGGQVLLKQLPTIEADPVQMRQMFQNLISNALKFHKPGIPPLVKVSSQTAPSPANKHQMVNILVEDNGIGFDEQQFETILQPFRRLHGRSEYEGTGMGLAIVKKIVERHHGEISARSTPGVGSTFIITLPLMQTS